MKNSGLLFNIQRFSIHDGPGIRTTAFMKGCNLNCFWCHNPESISQKQQIQFFSDKCIYCKECVRCPNEAHCFNENNHEFNRLNCIACGLCVESCYSEALVLSGKSYEIVELYNELKKDITFYTSKRIENENGGVTFSGGEPLLQSDFISGIAKMCYENKISVAIDTAGNVDFSVFEKVIPYTNLFLYDIKHWDNEIHKQVTGVTNERIIENLSKLLSLGKRVWVRIPLIPKVNASEHDIHEIGKLISNLQAKSGNQIELVELMPFHKIAIGKYISLNQDYQACDFVNIDKSDIDKYYKILIDYKLQVKKN